MDHIIDLFCLKTADYNHWKNEIVHGENLFSHFLKSGKGWKENSEAFEMWLRYFERETRRGKLNGNEMEQWKHAVKLFIFAEQVAKNKDQFSSIMEDEDKNKVRSFLNNLNKILEDFSNSSNIEIKFEENENLVLYCLFANTPQKKAVEVPFATDNGQIHILEIQPIKSYGGVSRNPKKIPKMNEYAREIKPNFHFSIKNAFSFWKTFWRENKDNELKQLWDQANPELHPDTFGIIWDVKPFYSEKLNQDAVNQKNSPKQAGVTGNEESGEKKFEMLHGESAGLAALVGIYHATLNKIPDSRVIYSVKIDSTEPDSKEHNLKEPGSEASDFKINLPTGKFSHVDKNGMQAKIKAAIETDFIDTFVMHEDNFSEDIKRFIDSNISRGKHFRVKTIDSEGTKKETYPHSEDKAVSAGSQ